jgi:hypothetical protein
MRKLFVTCAAAATMIMAGAFSLSPAQAMTITAPAGLSKAIHEMNLTQDVAYVCGWRWGWRRCWWTPTPYWGYYRPYRYSYYRPYYYRPYYAYAYRPSAYYAYAYRRPAAYYAYAYRRPSAYYAYAYSRPAYYRPYWWGWRYRRWWW